LNLDRVGVGLSDHPPATLITLLSDAYVMHELVQDLRASAFQGTSFSQVVFAGHSLGTLTSWSEASTYTDVDGLIGSGWLHVVNPTGVTTLTAASYPAILDPKFAGAGLTVGYLTTTPGSRGSIFYNQSDADANVIELDETLKQTGTDGELATYLVSNDPLVTLSLHIPVLTAVGQNDSILCSILVPCTNGQTLVQREGLFYTSHACLEGYALPGAGHDLNLHLNAQQWYATALDWINRRVGNGAQPPTQPCP
jgi:pimeloyl-ACP methyl ester carboxylesterase